MEEWRRVLIRGAYDVINGGREVVKQRGGWDHWVIGKECALAALGLSTRLQTR